MRTREKTNREQSDRNETTMDKIKFFIARGPVRGTISRHRSEKAAHKAVDRDRRQCSGLGRGAYSDAKVYAIHESGSMTGPYPKAGEF